MNHSFFFLLAFFLSTWPRLIFEDLSREEWTRFVLFHFSSSLLNLARCAGQHRAVGKEKFAINPRRDGVRLVGRKDWARNISSGGGEGTSVVGQLLEYSRENLKFHFAESFGKISARSRACLEFKVNLWRISTIIPSFIPAGPYFIFLLENGLL